MRVARAVGRFQQGSQRRQLTLTAREMRHRGGQLPWHTDLHLDSRSNQLRIAGQDALVQLPELWPRFYAQFAHQNAARLAVDGESFSTPAAPVQGEHQLSVEALPQWMLRYKSLQAGHELAVVAEMQAGLDLAFGRLQPQLLQPGYLQTLQHLRMDVRQGRASPQSERLGQQVRCLLPSTSVRSPVASPA